MFNVHFKGGELLYNPKGYPEPDSSSQRIEPALAESVKFENQAAALRIFFGEKRGTIDDDKEGSSYFIDPSRVSVHAVKDYRNCKACKIDCLQNLKGIPCRAPERRVARIIEAQEPKQEETQEEMIIDFIRLFFGVPQVPDVPQSLIDRIKQHYILSPRNPK